MNPIRSITMQSTAMRAVATLAASTLLLAAAGQVFAEDVEVTGSAPAICTLPDSWVFVTGFGGAAAGQFSGSTWNIPANAFANTNASAVAGEGYAIRIRGEGVCNVSHTIQLKSARGGLTADAASPPPAPAGFANRSDIIYEAHWSTQPVGSAARGEFGPRVTYTPTVAGQASSPMTYAVSAALPPPGQRAFDVRMSLQRSGAALPLLAGVYGDELTVTLSANP